MFLSTLKKAEGIRLYLTSKSNVARISKAKQAKFINSQLNKKQKL